MIEYRHDAATGSVSVWVNGARMDSDDALRAAMVCSPRQARLAMLQTPYEGAPSLLTAVEAAIYGSGDPALQVSWEYATEWRRNDPAIAQIGAAVGLSDGDIDALFVRAVGL